MRHGSYLVEINLISNLLLEYVNDYSEHPFPEYRLSWEEIKMLGRNSLEHAFVSDELKEQLLRGKHHLIFIGTSVLRLCADPMLQTRC